MKLDRNSRAALAVYRWLLLLYPVDHRARFGEEMVQLFRDRLRSESRGDSVAGILSVTWQTLTDLVLTAGIERSRTLRDRGLLLVPISLLAGFLIYFVDSSPGWDDTGITAGTLLLTAALFSFFRPRLAPLWVLTVGALMPAAYFLKTSDIRFLFILVVPLIGSLGGVVVRKAVGALGNPA